MSLFSICIVLIKCILIGICAILPGVSGSVIAVSLGIYDKIIYIIGNKKILKDNILFLFLTTIGLFVGIIFGSKILLYIFKFKTILYYSLTGIILSEVPFLIKKIYIKTNRGISFLPCVFAFCFSIILDLLNKTNSIGNYSVFKYFLGGILFAFGKVFPGISSSFFLLCLGIYDKIIILVTNPYLLLTNFGYYIPFIIGTIIGMIIFFKILSYLLNNYFRTTYSAIVGFVLSSVVVLFPQFNFDLNHWEKVWAGY